MSDRWIANKFGLFDFWYYDEEEFELSNGKIIFRGTGLMSIFWTQKVKLFYAAVL